jgi:hypothetical protein
MPQRGLPAYWSRVLLIIGVLVMLSPSAQSQMTQLGRAHLFWGEPNDIAVQQFGANTYAYVPLNESGTPVAQFDVTDPTGPEYMGHLDAPVWAWSAELLGERLYVPGAGGKVAIFDVSDPLNVARIGTIDNGQWNRPDD